MTKIAPQVRAQVHAWRGVLYGWRWRLRARKPLLVNLALMLAGAAGLLGFASLIGMWCLGLTGMVLSGALLYLGLNRDDGQEGPLRGARTVGQVLGDEALRP